jgi:hypothetical protein
MQADRNQPGWQAQPFLLYLLRRNLALLLYFVVAAAGMVGVYWFFQPESGATAAAVSAAGDETSLSAAIFKKVPARPVLQRFAQTPGPLHIALIAGHKDHDSGAVCDDGLTEAAVNLIIAEKVQALLLAANIRSEIFAEFDPRLSGYSGTALVSLHADSCSYINDLATGFKLSGSSLTTLASFPPASKQPTPRRPGCLTIPIPSPWTCRTTMPSARSPGAFRR